MSVAKSALVLAGSTAIASWFFSVGDVMAVAGTGLLTYFAIHWLASSQQDLAKVGDLLGAPAAMGAFLLYRGAGSVALYLPLTVLALTFFSQYLFELL